MFLTLAAVGLAGCGFAALLATALFIDYRARARRIRKAREAIAARNLARLSARMHAVRASGYRRPYGR